MSTSLTTRLCLRAHAAGLGVIRRRRLPACTALAWTGKDTVKQAVFTLSTLSKAGQRKYSSFIPSSANGGYTARTNTLNKAVTALDDNLYAYLLAHTREAQVLRELRDETAVAYPERRNNQIAPEQGALLAWLVETLRVARAVEVGVFTGYSALATALACALPAQALPEDGRLVACDRDASSLAIARRAWDAAGVGHKVEERLGPASESLEALLAEGHAGSFDLAFIDADKRGYAGYFEQLLRLVRRGGVIAVDNILWKGRVADAGVEDNATVAIRDFNAQLLKDERVSLAFVPIGDGMALCTKRGA